MGKKIAAAVGFRDPLDALSHRVSLVLIVSTVPKWARPVSWSKGPTHVYDDRRAPNIPPFLKCGLPPSCCHEELARIPWCLKIFNNVGVAMVVVVVAAMVEVDLDKLREAVGHEVVVVLLDGYPVEVGVAVDGNLGEEGSREVAVTVKAKVVLVADQALREDSDEGDDAVTEDVAIVIVVVVEAEAALIHDEAAHG